MPEQLQKAINLAKRTGDRIIVFDNFRTEDAFVIMDLDCYEKMLNSQEEIRSLTEDELLDRINRDVALWRNESNQNNEDLSEPVNNEFIEPFDMAPLNDIRVRQDKDNSHKQAFSNAILEDPFDVTSLSDIRDRPFDFAQDPSISRAGKQDEEDDSFDSAQDEDLYYYEDTLENLEQTIANDDADNNNFSEEFEDKNKKNNWRIPSGIKEAADEVVEDIPF